MGYALGVDLGTTYTAAGVASGGRVDIFQLGTRVATIPSVVVLRADGEVLVGEAAERRALTEPSRTAREFKRRLGDPTPLILGGTPYGAESLMAHLLRNVVARVAEQQGGAPDAVVVTHPANYGAYKLDLLREAVRLSGVEHASFLTEPQAAAFHYAKQQRIEPGSTIAVYDFGGGTFDAAVLRCTADGRFELIGTPEGMERLGGIDFDEAVFRHVIAALGDRASTLDGMDEATSSALARLREECREAKEALSVDTDVTIPVALPGLQTEVRLTRAEFESMVRPRLQETFQALERAVRSAGMRFEDIGQVLLVGGSSRIPLVGQLVREVTGRPIALDAHPKHAIAMGAAAWAAELSTTVQPATATAVMTTPDATTSTSAAAPVASTPAYVESVAPAETPKAAAPLATPPALKPAGTPGGGMPKWLLPVAGGGLALAAVAVVAVMALGGGGGSSDDGDEDEPEATRTASAAATATASPTARTLSTAAGASDTPTAVPTASVPEGYMDLHAAGLPAIIAVPSDWTSYSSSLEGRAFFEAIPPDQSFAIGMIVAPAGFDPTEALDEIVFESNGAFEIVTFGGPYGAFEESMLVLVMEAYPGSGPGGILTTWQSLPGSGLIFVAAESNGQVVIAFAEAADETSLTVAEAVLGTIVLD